jgi:hypothetical protein
MDQDNAAQQNQGRTLADLFFHQRDKKLIEELSWKEKIRERKKALSEASGITNDEILQKLADLNVKPEILPTLAMVPLVEVAWAGGKVDEKEKAVVLELAQKAFIVKENPNFDLLNEWLRHRPNAGLFRAWEHYIKGICGTLLQQQKITLKNVVVVMATQVAKASGGFWRFLGFGNKISKKEKAVLAKIESAFD